MIFLAVISKILYLIIHDAVELTANARKPERVAEALTKSNDLNPGNYVLSRSSKVTYCVLRTGSGICRAGARGFHSHSPDSWELQPGCCGRKRPPAAAGSRHYGFHGHRHEQYRV